MKTKTQHLTSHYGSKGFIFTLDMLAASIIVAITLVVATFYASQASEYKLSQLNMITTGSDILARLDNSGTLQTLNASRIGNETQTLLPEAYGIRIQIISQSHPSLDTGAEIPTGTFIASGKRYFYAQESYNVARFYIWLKE